MVNESNQFSHPNLPPLPSREDDLVNLKPSPETLIKKIMNSIEKKTSVIASMCALVIISLIGLVAYQIYFNSGPRFGYNVNGEGVFGNSTHPEDDDISYVKIKQLTDPSGVKSYYVVMDVTNYSSERSSYSINAALVCDGFKKFESDLNISGLLPSETKHLEQRINNELKVKSCVATFDVSRYAS